jgi:hypothetical protein
MTYKPSMRQALIQSRNGIGFQSFDNGRRAKTVHACGVFIATPD